MREAISTATASWPEIQDFAALGYSGIRDTAISTILNVCDSTPAHNPDPRGLFEREANLRWGGEFRLTGFGIQINRIS